MRKTKNGHSPKSRGELNLMRRLEPYAEKVKLGRIFSTAKTGRGLCKISWHNRWATANISLSNMAREIHVKSKPDCESEIERILENSD